MKKCIVIIVLFAISLGYTQLPNHDIWLEAQLESSVVRAGDSYRLWQEDLLLPADTSRSFNFGTDLFAGYKNNALSPFYRDMDNEHLSIHPYFNGRINTYLTYQFRMHIENNRDDFLDLNKTYEGHEFSGMRGYVSRGFLQFQSRHFLVKFGRDYFMPGYYHRENLLFSKYNHPYDQIRISYQNDWLQYTVYYLNLHLRRVGGEFYQNHINGHRLSVNLGDHGYWAVNELLMYGGVNRDPELSLFNPFLLYYMYRKNIPGYSGNTQLSTEIYYELNNMFIHAEALLDDFQIEKEDSLDNEPTEYGLNITLGYQNMLKNTTVKLNYTRVANRTYNTPVASEKYLYKNLPVGHYLGNNFWETSLTIAYNDHNRLSGNISAVYREYGDEGLYAPFNLAFADYPTGEYEEDFPFGTIRKQSGVLVNLFYTFNKNFLIHTKAGYWLEKGNLEETFSYFVGVGYRL